MNEIKRNNQPYFQINFISKKKIIQFYAFWHNDGCHIIFGKVEPKIEKPSERKKIGNLYNRFLNRFGCMITTIGLRTLPMFLWKNLSKNIQQKNKSQNSHTATGSPCIFNDEFGKFFFILIAFGC